MARKMVVKNTRASEPVLPIALVFGRDRDSCSDALRGIRRYALERDNWALVSIFPHRRLAESLGSLRPAGIIVNAAYPGIVDILRKASRPVVTITASVADSHFSYITFDEASIGVLAANHLLECGLRSFGYFGPPWCGPDSEREGGFCQTLRRLSYVPAVCYTRPSGSNPHGGTFVSKKHICQWVRQLPKPAGVFAPNDMWALWLCGVCKQEGIKVPEDIAIIGAGNDELMCELSQPSLSSIAIPAERIGYEAAALLDRLIKREPMPSEPVLLSAAGVVTRQSTDVLAVTDPDLVTAVNFMREHISEPFAVEDVLQHVALQRRAFERKFREALGRSPAQEIRRMRIARAKTLLTGDNQMKMESIAQHCGFSSAVQFFAAFHQATGMTPTDYRITMKQESNQRSSYGDVSANSSAREHH
jgi:LacI family transcriptional regulator